MLNAYQSLEEQQDYILLINITVSSINMNICDFSGEKYG